MFRSPAVRRCTGVFAILLAGCGDQKDPDPDSGGGGVPPGPAHVFELSFGMDDSSCQESPTARRYHQMAYFLRETGLHYTGPGGADRVTERGFLVYGGENLDGTPKDDLWLFDLGRRHMDSCPWTKLSADATDTDGIAGGVLGYSAAENAFYLVGGRTADGTGWRPTQYDFRLDNLGARILNRSGTNLSQIHGWEFLGDPLCIAEEWGCWCEDPDGCDDGQGGTFPEGALISTWRMGGVGDVEGHKRALCDQSDNDWTDAAPPTPDLYCTGGACSVGCTVEPDFLHGCNPDPWCLPENDDLFDFAFGEYRDMDGVVSDQWMAQELHVASIPGRHGAAGTWDPRLGQAVLYGGSVGCTGSACTQPHLLNGGLATEGALAAEFAEMLDGDGQGLAEALYGGNTNQLVVFDPAAEQVLYASDLGHTSWAPSVGPAEATFGVHGSAAALFGLEWAYSDKTWTPGPAGAALALWGGTYHQEVLPRRSRVITSPKPWDQSTLETWADMDAHAPWDMTLPDQYKFRRVDMSSKDVAELSGGDNAGVYDSAATRLESDLVAVLGGRASWAHDGVDTLHVLQRDGTVHSSFQTDPVYGAAGVHDPIVEQAWFFGAFENPQRADLLKVIDKNGAGFSERHPTWVVKAFEQQLRIEDPDHVSPEEADWLAEAVFTAQLDCGSGTCWSNRITLEFPEYLYSTNNLDVSMIVDGEDVPLKRKSEPAKPGGFGRKRAIYLSPISMVDGEIYAFRVQMKEKLDTGHMRNFPDEVSRGIAYGVYGGSGSCGLKRWVATEGFYAWPVDDLAGDQDDSPSDYDETSFVHHGVRIGPPTGWGVAGPGALDASCGTTPFFELDPNDPDFDYPEVRCFGMVDLSQRPQLTRDKILFDMVETIDHIGTYAVGDFSANVWMDGCLDAGTQAELMEYLDGAGQRFVGDNSFVTDRIGDGTKAGEPDPDLLTPFAVIFMRTNPAVSVAGTTVGATVVNAVFAWDGVGYALDTPGPDLTGVDIIANTTLHELAHLYGKRRTYEDETSWLREGIPSLLEAMRHPSTPENMLFHGMFYRHQGLVKDDDPGQHRYFWNLENDTPPDQDARIRRDYFVGAYTLAYLSAMKGDTGSNGWLWLRIRNRMVVGDYGDPITTNDVRGWYDELGSFLYGRYVQGQYDFGQPIVGIKDVDLTPGALSVTIEQSQQHVVSNNGIPFDVFPHVPYALGCETPDGNAPFDECLATRSTIADLSLTNDESVLIPLTPAAGIDTDTGDYYADDSTQAFWFGVIANHKLLPGAMPTYHVTMDGDPPPADGLSRIAPTWLLACGNGSVHYPDCAVNSDTDDWADAGDCADGNPNRHPGKQDPAAGKDWKQGESLVDRNCDGWPVNWWIP